MKHCLVLLLTIVVLFLGTDDSLAVKRCLNIKVIVPYAVGTGTDLVFRAYTETINRQSSGALIKVLNKTHKTVIEENMKNRPDGCQFLAVTQSLIADFLMSKTSLEWSSFAPVAMLTRTPLAVVARGDMKDANLPNLIENALGKPATIRIGETENSLQRAFRMQIEDVSGVSFDVTTFENARQTLLALLGSKLDLGMVSVSAAKRRSDLKQLRILALTDILENSKLAEIPSLQEQGIDLSFGVDRILLGPQNTSNDIVLKMSERFKKAAEDPELTDRLGKINTKPLYLDPDELTRYFENLTADWTEMMARLANESHNKKSP
tara:strand:- start:2477 stop:3439 length:963 start_codon:yes stop_codon:yes gene_type:complete